MLVIQNVLVAFVQLDKEDIMTYDSFKKNPEVVEFDKKWKELMLKMFIIPEEEKENNEKIVRVENSSFNEE